MIHTKTDFKLITPCFCAGADQSEAEIRPSAIRGALRWWFRSLGGTRDEEELVFGGVSNPSASSLQVRVSDIRKVDVGILPSPKPMTPLAYILYFPSIAGGDGANFGTGPRWNSKGCLGPGSTFQLHLRQFRKLPDHCAAMLELSIDALRHYGSIGLRTTRGFGAMQAAGVNENSFATLDAELQKHGFVIRRGSRLHDKWDSLMDEAGKWLKNDLRKDFGAGGGPGRGGKPPQATALGSINPVRQTSAVHLRPVEIKGKLIFSAFEAPHDRVLGPESNARHKMQVLVSKNFTQAPPSS